MKKILSKVSFIMFFVLYYIDNCIIYPPDRSLRCPAPRMLYRRIWVWLCLNPWASLGATIRKAAKRYKIYQRISLYIYRVFSCWLTGAFSSSVRRAATSWPRFGRISRYIFLISGHERSSFSTSTCKLIRMNNECELSTLPLIVSGLINQSISK